MENVRHVRALTSSEAQCIHWSTSAKPIWC